jgi:hypothetical protein
VTLAVVLAAAPAFAQPPGETVPAPAADGVAATSTRAPYTSAISLQLASLDTTGIAIQLERAVPQYEKLSVAVTLGARAAARGDYRSHAFGIGVEVRRWLRRPEAMTGWYVGARSDLARTQVSDMIEDRAIGGLTTWTTGVTTGYRWVLFHRVELTPSIGLAMVVEGGMHGMSPTTARGAGVIGLTAGAIF